MKKVYYCIIAFASSFAVNAQNGQITNGGFENWSSEVIYDYTTVWGCSNSNQYQGVATTLKSIDAQHGTYSAEITAAEVGSMPDTTFGYVYHGVVGQSGPESGIAFSAIFNEVRFKYKCDIPVGEDFFLMIIRFNGGVMTEMILEPAGSGTNTASWINGSVLVTNNPQEELFIGFIMGDPNGPRPTPGSWARIDNVEIFNSGTLTTNLPDPSFESWASASTETPDNWFTMNELLAGIGMENVSKSTNSNSGTYAAEISTVQFPPITGDTIRGFISKGAIDFNNWSNPFLPIAYNASPTVFTGFYDYSPSNMDQGNVQLIFYEAGSIIGNVSQSFLGTMGYSPFALPISLTGTPDSMVLVVFSGDHPGSVLLVDDLSLSGGNVSLEEFEKFTVSVYPSPATEKVMIKSIGVYNFELVDLAGNVILEGKNLSGSESIDVSNISSGSYLMKITNASTTEVHALVIE